MNLPRPPPYGPSNSSADYVSVKPRYERQHSQSYAPNSAQNTCNNPRPTAIQRNDKQMFASSYCSCSRHCPQRRPSATMYDVHVRKLYTPCRYSPSNSEHVAKEFSSGPSIAEMRDAWEKMRGPRFFTGGYDSESRHVRGPGPRTATHDQRKIDEGESIPSQEKEGELKKKVRFGSVDIRVFNRDDPAKMEE